MQLCMMPSTWLVNWSSKQFRVGILELVKTIKGNRKTTKETPTTITSTTTTTTIVIKTTTITNNKTGGRKLPGPMLQPQLKVEVMLEIYQGATIATLTTMGNAFQSVESDKELVIRRKIARLGFQVQELPLQDVTCYGCDEKGHYKYNYPNDYPYSSSERRDSLIPGERPKKDPGSLTRIKADEKKLDDIRVV
ncbi:hypothetical protein Tco_0003398 [Tanacetum coccineum]